MADDADPVLSAVIVNWNSGEALSACLSSLAEQPPAMAWEAIVVDNGSTDGSLRSATDAAPWARVIENRRNRGLAAANNQGMVAARGQVYLICNPDVVFRAGAVEELVATLSRHPAAAFAIPRLVQHDGVLHVSAGDLPTLSEALAGRQLQRWRAGRGTPDSGAWWDLWPHDTERRIGRGHEAAYAVRRTAVEHVGLQDERFVLDWEGVDWTARMREAGWEVWFTPAAEVVHLGGVSIRQVPFRSVVSSHLGMYHYFAKHRSPAWRPLLAAAVGIRAAAKLGAVATGVAMYDRAHRAGRLTSPSPEPYS
jgi:N-acetylglucosaminyl-diphospho-decaprenol L-rhamnosyltransferase